MKKEVLSICIFFMLSTLTISGCLEEEKQKSNYEGAINGLLLSSTNGSSCFFFIVEGFTFERFVNMWETSSESEMAYYQSHIYLLTRNESLIWDDNTSYVYDAMIDGTFKMNDEISVTGTKGTIEDPENINEIRNSIDIITIEMIKDNSP